MHIKIYFVNRFMGVPCDETSTAQDVIEWILQRNMVPLAYAKVCALIYNGKDKYGVPMLPTQMMSEVKDTQVHFRVLSLPLPDQIHGLDSNFLFLVQSQLQKVISNRVWVVDEEAVVKLGAYLCGIEFGPYSAEKHPVGFLAKTLENYVPKYFASQRKTEPSIMKEWKALSERGEASTKEKAIVSYVETAGKLIKQFGSATVDVKILKVDNEEFSTPIFMSVTKKQIMLITVDGSVILDAPWEKVVMDMTDPDPTKFTVKAEKTCVLECPGIQAFVKVINFIKASQYPTPEEVAMTRVEGGQIEQEVNLQQDLMNPEFDRFK